jgi:hypothetical protein
MKLFTPEQIDGMLKEIRAAREHPYTHHLDARQHRIIHANLHAALDELAADFIEQTGRLLGETSVVELMEWSAKQMDSPDQP